MQTIAANFWPRGDDLANFPCETLLYRTEPDVLVEARLQRPPEAPNRTLLLLHGLESSAESGYMRSLAHAALLEGYLVLRLNTRTCGGTERHSKRFYHAGLTSDVRVVLGELTKAGFPRPWIVGFSLGANVALKLAGEMGESAREIVSGVAAVSPPLDLEACSRRMSVAAWRIYDRRFTRRLKNKYRRFHFLYPERFPLERIRGVSSVLEFDDRITAPAFGFGDAVNYYRTQSCGRFLDGIRVPTFVLHAQDDPLIPFESFRSPVLLENPHIATMFPERGGHVAFLARGAHRFWVDVAVLDWIQRSTEGASRAVGASRPSEPLQ